MEIDISDLAPIVLFTYNRPEHTRITLEYLSKCELCSESILYVFCDGPNENASQSNVDKIDQVKRVIKSKKWAKEVIINEAVTNNGLAKNVIEGVSKVVNKHGKAIVLEDDLLIGKYFLRFINTALSKYEYVNQVKQVSGFLFPIDIPSANGSLFLPVTNTIGWGTWKRSWDEVDLNAIGYEKLKVDSSLRHKFNLNGSYNYTKMLINQVEKHSNDSWAILYWWSIFKSQGLTLFPDYSLIQHNDFDSSGFHDSNFNHYNQTHWNENYKINLFPSKVENNSPVFKVLTAYIKKNNRITLSKILFKVKIKILRLLGI